MLVVRTLRICIETQTSYHLRTFGWLEPTDNLLLSVVVEISGASLHSVHFALKVLSAAARFRTSGWVRLLGAPIGCCMFLSSVYLPAVFVGERSDAGATLAVRSTAPGGEADGIVAYLLFWELR